MSEKRKPHYSLDEIKRLVSVRESRLITKTALKTAVRLDITLPGILDCINKG